MQTKIKIAVFLLFIGIFLPIFSAHAGLVPCGLSEGTAKEIAPCTLCHLILGIFNIFTWFKNILITVAAVGIFIAGVMYIISSGNEEMMKNAKSFLNTSLTGFVIVLGAWLIVNSVMWILSYNVNNLGITTATNWYTFTCDTTSTAKKSDGKVSCSCANLISTKYVSVGSSTAVLDETSCQKNCLGAGATYYKFNNSDNYKKLP